MTAGTDNVTAAKPNAQATADATLRLARELDANFLVEAGAGTGKTYALVSRVVALVKSGVGMANIVAITFTEAAAAELSERIRSRLEQLLDSSHPDNANDLLFPLTGAEQERLAQARQELDRASIQTIHSFAAQLLRERPLDVGLPPGWTQWDELDASQNFAQRWDAWLEWALGAGDTVDPALQNALRYWLAAGIGIPRWRTLALAFSTNYYRLRNEDCFADADLPTVARNALERLQELAAECTNHADRLFEQLSGAIATVQAVADAAGDPVDAANALAAGAVVDHTRSVGIAANWNRPTVAIRAEFRGIGRAFQQAVKTASLYPMLHPLLHNLRQQFAVDYEQDRKADGVATFDDLLVWARDLLRSDDARQYLQGRYTHILIDEFQDTDPLQAEIGFYLAAAATGEQPWETLPLQPGRLFLVGDAQQSIYRFRRADLQVVNRVKAAGRLQRLALTENRRSQNPVLDWVNRLFPGLMTTGDAAHPVQADYIRLFPHAGIQHKGLGSVQVFGESLAANASAVRRQQARHVANLVVAYATDGGARLNVYDQAGRRLRPASLGDVCILIRSRTGLRILERGLEDAGIPHRIEGGSLLFDTQEVQDLLNCLRAIDDPFDAVSVVAALRSPAFACSDLDLLNWREAGGSWNYLSDAMDNAPAAHSVPHGMAKLREYHLCRHELTVSRLVSKFVRERRLEELDLAEYRPREVWRRRQFLIEQARSLESASAQSSWNLRRFLHWAETQQAESARIAELAVPETDDDAVRIMTMHAAKGLEFPIVIMLGLDSVPRRSPAAALFDTDTGTMQVSVGSGETRVQTLGYEDIAAMEERHRVAEETRLAYVAATRARDHLLVSLYHRYQSNGSPPNAVIGAILDQRHSLPHSEVAVAADPVVAMLAAGAATGQPAMSYDLDSWQNQRDGSIRKRSLPQAVTPTWLAQRGAPESLAAVENKDAEPDAEQPWRTGRGGTAFGSALHAVLQETVGLMSPQLPLPGAAEPDTFLAQWDDTVEGLAEQHAAAEGVKPRRSEIARLAQRALRNPAVVAGLRAPRLWAEIPVAARIETPRGPVVIEGIIDLLYQDDDDRLVILDYKSDYVPTEAAVQDKLARYQWQGAAYAAAVTQATGRTVKDVQFLFVQIDQARRITNLPELMGQLPEVIARG